VEITREDGPQAVSSQERVPATNPAHRGVDVDGRSANALIVDDAIAGFQALT
jgi:hypothetical protein